MYERQYNVRIHYIDGRIDGMEFGEFGPVGDTSRATQGAPVFRGSGTALVHHPIFPALAGASAIAQALGHPVTDRFFQSL